jgi:hypothetical protein
LHGAFGGWLFLGKNFKNMSGWKEIEVGNVTLIHHSTSSLIEMVITKDEEVEQGQVEKVMQKVWFDYGTFSDLRESINKI